MLQPQLRQPQQWKAETLLLLRHVKMEKEEELVTILGVVDEANYPRLPVPQVLLDVQLQNRNETLLLDF